MGISLPIYLDNHATTCVDPRVCTAMEPYFSCHFGNYSSLHSFGKSVRDGVENARQQIADLVGAKSDQVVFTSGATESNNLAIKGVADAFADRGRHIITVQTEHKAVLDTCRYLEKYRGFEVTYLPVDDCGRITPEQVEEAIRVDDSHEKGRTVLVSVMGANNEIGTIHPIAEIGSIARKHNVLFHVDGAQAVGKIPIDIKSNQIDLLSVSGHKIYGPKGVGALIVNRDNPNLEIVPQMHGGGQEFGLRAGTIAGALVVGLGEACFLCKEEMKQEMEKLSFLRDRLERGIKPVAGMKINGNVTHRLPGNLNITFEGIDGELLAIGLKDVAFSSTSACSSGSVQPSHVLRAIGRTPEEAFSSIRFGIGRFNTEAEIDYVIEQLNCCLKKFQRPRACDRAEVG